MFNLNKKILNLYQRNYYLNRYILKIDHDFIERKKELRIHKEFETDI